MRKKTKKIINFVLIILIIFVVVFNVLLISSDGDGDLKTSLVRKYWGGSTQCVAYVQKYYKEVFDMEIRNVGRAQDLYLKAPTYNLFAHRNGGRIAPQPGNILVFEHRNRVGHVAMVTGRLRNGVLISEQNWGTSRITTNGNKALPMTVTEGNYFVHDREGYKVLGWVGLNLENPTQIFDFSSESSAGWMIEHNMSSVIPSSADVWSVLTRGARPSIIGPVFIEPLSVEKQPRVEFRALSFLGTQEEKAIGKIHLRDEDDEWSAVLPFEVKNENSLVDYSVDLSSLRDDFAVTQMRIELPGYRRASGNLWEFDRLELK